VRDLRLRVIDRDYELLCSTTLDLVDLRARGGLQLLVDALTPDDGYGAVLLVARPEMDPVPALSRARRRRSPPPVER
jgi:hypothetical protein